MGNCLKPQTFPKESFSADPAAVNALVEGTATLVKLERGERFKEDFKRHYDSLQEMVGKENTDLIVAKIYEVFPTDCEAFIVKLAAVVDAVFEKNINDRLRRLRA